MKKLKVNAKVPQNSKNNLYYAIIVSVFFTLFLTIISCSDDYKKYDRYTNTYYQVLIARELHEDSSKANNEVKKILAENGYTEKQFAEETYKIFKEDQKVLTMIIDSLRKRVIRDTDSLQKEKMKEMLRKAADSTKNANKN